MRKGKGPGGFIYLFSVSLWLVTLDTHTFPSHVPPPYTSLWSCTGVFGQQLATGGQNVFGVCPMSNGIVHIVSGCHFARWRGPFSVPVLWLGGEREGGSKGAPWRAVKGAVEDGVRALFNLSKLTNASSSCPRCTHTPTEGRGLQTYQRCSSLDVIITEWFNWHLAYAHSRMKIYSHKSYQKTKLHILHIACTRFHQLDLLVFYCQEVEWTFRLSKHSAEWLLTNDWRSRSTQPHKSRGNCIVLLPK